jgi:hypothetical protein
MDRLVALAEFTGASKAALRYAGGIAHEYSLPLTLVRTYAVPLPFPATGGLAGDGVQPVYLPIAEMRQTADDQLRQELAWMRTEFPELSMQSRLLYGNAEEALNETDDLSGEATLFIANDTTHDWLSADAAHALRHAHQPVIAIPDAVTFRPVGSIALAIEPKAKANNIPVAPLLSWLRLTGARLHIVCISDEVPAVIPDALRQMFEAHNPEYHQVSGAEGIKDGLLRAIEAFSFDWLAVVPHSHGLLGNLFHKDHLKELAKDCPIPLMALHMPD